MYIHSFTHGPVRQVWDLGGQANLRPSWATYYRSTDAVIVVVDSTDRARASIAKARSAGHMPWPNHGLLCERAAGWRTRCQHLPCKQGARVGALHVATM